MTADPPVPAVPLLEDDLADAGLISPAGAGDLPALAVLCWFREVVDAVHTAPDATVPVRLVSENGVNPVSVVRHRGHDVAVVHPGVGAPMAAAVFEELIGRGVRVAVGCGGAGALTPELVLGHAVVVDSAVRDEGTSFHYLPPGRVVGVDGAVVTDLVATATAAGVAHVVGRTWTTDAFYRETRSRTTRRVAEGCVVVEMEAAALLAVAAFRGVTYGQLLMAGDSLAGQEWDHRGWTGAADPRAALFGLALDAAAALGERLGTPSA